MPIKPMPAMPTRIIFCASRDRRKNTDGCLFAGSFLAGVSVLSTAPKETPRQKLIDLGSGRISLSRRDTRLIAPGSSLPEAGHDKTHFKSRRDDRKGQCHPILDPSSGTREALPHLPPAMNRRGYSRPTLRVAPPRRLFRQTRPRRAILRRLPLRDSASAHLNTTRRPQSTRHG